VNQVTLMGNLTRDVEMRHTSGNNAVGNFGIAVNRRFTSNGEKREEVTFVDCEAWGKTAELIAQYFAKGRPILVSGRLKLDTWEKDGQKHSKLRVVVENFYFCGGKDEGGKSQPEQVEARRRGPAPAAVRDAMDEDDIPF
jgi:single-strand DNA-binding protein